MKIKPIRRALAAALAISMLCAFPVHAQNTQDIIYPSASAQIPMTGTVTPSYEVVIPTIAPVTFPRSDNSIGDLSVTRLNLEPGKKLMAKVEKGEMINQSNKKSTLPYTAGFKKNPDGTDLLNPVELKSGDSYGIHVNITDEAWNKAVAGKYKGELIVVLSQENAV